MRAARLLPLFCLLLASAVIAPNFQVTAVTSCAGGAAIAPVLSEDGRKVHFLSNCNPTGDNPDLEMEIFVAQRGRVEQLTRGSYCRVEEFAVARDGRIAFISNCPLSGKNQDQGMEVMVRDRHGAIQVLTRSYGLPNRDLAWAGDGRLYFVSGADLAGQNPDASSEVFSVDPAATPRQFKQHTQTLAPRGCGRPALVTGGILSLCDDDIPGTELPSRNTGLAVRIEGRPIGGNPDHNPELLLFGTEGEVRQLTRTAECRNGPPAADSAGRLVAFVSDCDFAAGATVMADHAAQPELYLLRGSRVTPLLPGFRLPATDLAWSRDGATLVFSAPIFSEVINPQRNTEIFLLRINELRLADPGRPGPLPRGLYGVTDFPAGVARMPFPNANASAIAFQANFNHERRNSDGGFEIFVARPGPKPETDEQPEPREGDTADSAEADPPETDMMDEEQDEAEEEPEDTEEPPDEAEESPPKWDSGSSHP